MPIYAYKAIDTQKKLQTGTSEADTFESLSEALKTKGLFLMEAKALTPRPRPAPPGISAPSKLPAVVRPPKAPGAVKSVSMDVLTIFTSEFSIMLRSGLPINNALNALARQQKDPGFKRVLGEVLHHVQEGNTLSSVFGRYPQAFDSIFIALVGSGEASGNVPAMLERLSAYLTFRRELRTKVRSALVYPAMIMITGLSVVLFLILFILPNFATMFEQTHTALPLPTQILLGVSHHLRTRGWIYVVALVAAVFVLRRWSKTSTHFLAVEEAKLRLPVLGPLIRNIVMTRILRTLGALTASGVPILDSLRLAGDAASHIVFCNILKRVSQSASEGKGLAIALSGDRYFPEMAADMIANAELTGTLPQVMDQISDFYEKETDVSIRNLFALIEPLFVIVLGLLVGAIAVAILLPIFQMGNTVG